MARGGQDFGYPDYQFGAANVDNNEIQQMLLGFGLLDGLGRTVIYDDFSSGLGKWTVTANGAPVRPFISPHERTGVHAAFRSPFCAEIITGSVLNAEATMASSMYVGNMDRIGLEVGFYMHSNSPNVTFYASSKKTGLGVRTLGLKFDRVNNQVLVKSAAGDLDISSYLPNIYTSVKRVRFKIIASVVDNQYSRLVVGDTSIPLSGLQLYNFVSQGDDAMGVYISALGYVGSTEQLYIGYVRLTKDEP